MLLWYVIAGVACLIIIPATIKVRSTRRKLRESEAFLTHLKDAPAEPLALTQGSEAAASAALEPPLPEPEVVAPDPDAARRRVLARQLRDAPVAAWLEAAREAEPDDAYMLLNEAALRFPDAAEAHQALAEVAEQRGDVETAERAWGDVGAVKHNSANWSEIAFGAPPEMAGAATLAPIDGQTSYANTDDKLGRQVAEGEAADLHPHVEAMPVPVPSGETSHQTVELAEAPNSASSSDIPDELLDSPVEAWLEAARAAQPEDAYALLNATALRFPNVADVNHDLARAAEQRADWATAERAWRDFISVDPYQWWAYTGLADALKHQEKWREAETVVENAYAHLPTEPWLLVELARLAQNNGNWDAALDYWDRVICFWPDRPEGVIGRSVALNMLGHAKAEEAAFYAANLFPNHSEPLHDLARHSERRSDWIAAEGWWRKFIDLRPNFWWAHLQLSKSLQEQGRIEDAQAVLADAIRNFPDEPEIRAQSQQLISLSPEKVQGG